jgi:hypothetical protein
LLQNSFIFGKKGDNAQVQKRSKRKFTYLHLLGTQCKICTYVNVILGTIPILRQLSDWVGGVRKMANFADVYRMGEWFRKIPKIC